MVQKDAFTHRFKKEDIHDDNPAVQDWLSNITADKKGYVFLNISG